jgi:hypothetical protein
MDLPVRTLTPSSSSKFPLSTALPHYDGYKAKNTYLTRILQLICPDLTRIKPISCEEAFKFFMAVLDNLAYIANFLPIRLPFPWL